MRTGIVARKIGMTRIFTDDGVHIPVTVLDMADCVVVGQRTAATDGYCALQLATGAIRSQSVSKPMRGHFAQAGVEPRRYIAEFRIENDHFVPVGSRMTADHFAVGQKVDISGTSHGKGFAGAMKRHHFKGLRATHGVSVSHRSHGATGSCQDPGRVWKGKKMAGHMGAKRITTQNLDVVAVDVEQGLLMVCGAVPGSRGGWVMVRDAVKHRLPEGIAYPGAFIPPDPASLANGDNENLANGDNENLANGDRENSIANSDNTNIANGDNNKSVGN